MARGRPPRLSSGIQTSTGIVDVIVDAATGEMMTLIRDCALALSS